MSALITFGTLNITGILRGERERVFAQDGQRQQDIALPLRADYAVLFDRKNRLYTVKFELTRFFATVTEAQRFRQQHPDDVFAAGQNDLQFTNADTTVDKLTAALGNARILKHVGQSVDVAYEFQGAPWTFGILEE